MSKLVTTRFVDAGELDRMRTARTGMVAERRETAADGDGGDHDGDRGVDGNGRVDGDGAARDGVVAFALESGPFDEYRRVVTVEADGSVTETTTYRLAVPVWGFLFAPLVRRALRDPGPDDHRPWWMPPDRLDARAAQGLALRCVFSAFSGYLGTLLSQTNSFFKQEFGVGNDQIGTMLAAVRIGALLALVVVAFADRRGRRWVLMASALAACVLTATGALAPNLLTLGISQTIARAFVTALILVIGIIAAEEMPAGSRAFAMSVLAATAALGAGFCVMLIGVAELGTAAWRILYLVPLAAIPTVVRLGRRIPETERFARRHIPVPVTLPAPTAGSSLSARTRAAMRATGGLDRGRLALLSASGFFFSLFVAPAGAFLVEYLRTNRGFGGGSIIAFQLLTNTPGGVGIVVGGKLADRHGRRVIGAIGMAGGAVFTIAMYLMGGPIMWLWSLLGALIGAMAIPALAVYGPELFPTDRRGRANGLINLWSVLGSAAGLAAAGILSRRLSGIGSAIAVLGIGPLAVILLILVFYPETAARELEDINPSDADPGEPSTPHDHREITS